MVSAEDILSIIQENEITVELKELDHSVSLSDQGLDSLDVVTILFAIEEKFRIKIPEVDIDEGKLNSINAIVEYLNHKKS